MGYLLYENSKYHHTDDSNMTKLLFNFLHALENAQFFRVFTYITPWKLMPSNCLMLKYHFYYFFQKVFIMPVQKMYNNHTFLSCIATYLAKMSQKCYIFAHFKGIYPLKTGIRGGKIEKSRKTTFFAIFLEKNVISSTIGYKKM